MRREAGKHALKRQESYRAAELRKEATALDAVIRDLQHYGSEAGPEESDSHE